MKDVAFIKVNPKDSKIEFGLFPQILTGIDKLVQEVYLALLQAFQPLLSANIKINESDIFNIVKLVEETVLLNQAGAQLPINERLSRLVIKSVEIIGTDIKLDLNMITEVGELKLTLTV
ncbi:MAG: hypothetical protein QXP66_00865 [Candidatus Aenigmatarchaeota archaeon]